MSTDECTRLFQYMGKCFNQIDAALERKTEKGDINCIMTTLDALAKRQQINDDERAVMIHHIEQLDHWVHQLADRIGVQLSA